MSGRGRGVFPPGIRACAGRDYVTAKKSLRIDVAKVMKVHTSIGLTRDNSMYLAVRSSTISPILPFVLPPRFHSNNYNAKVHESRTYTTTAEKMQVMHKQQLRPSSRSFAVRRLSQCHLGGADGTPVGTAPVGDGGTVTVTVMVDGTQVSGRTGEGTTGVGRGAGTLVGFSQPPAQ
ncbi:hypothetical protein EJ05DRAFT_371909 [Pseudovirgaria hyperparasitica]|uniref:Uncharacterized protein n=1 Tax=Pseudovirgaria hyperparasitica TaxID=470096 RepID=A0A6A6W6U0_9PEZI|nr:uncharacterized protein EJ05DRAFT_371909 [Pseudovirgaria hyperparasitica]KAF2757919.1 hypothetical protein EJ05DRAFT_371909 [Pseudovirgaria hyperparasitica]